MASLEGQASDQAVLPFGPYDAADTMSQRHQQWGKMKVKFMESSTGRITINGHEVPEQSCSITMENDTPLEKEFLLCSWVLVDRTIERGAERP